MSVFKDNIGKLLSILNAIGLVTQVTALGKVTSGAVTLTAATVSPQTTITLGANTTFKTPKPIAGSKLVVLIKQDTVGSRTGTWSTTASGYVHFPTGTHTLSTAATYVDKVTLTCDDGVGWNATLQKHMS